MSHRENKAALFGTADPGKAPASAKAKATGKATATRAAPSRATQQAGAASAAGTAERRAERLKEAAQCRKQAKSLLTKTWKQWTPNYFMAAPLLEKAAACYRTAGDDANAEEMFAQAADAQLENESFPLAAKNLKEAASFATKRGDEHAAAGLYHRCAEAWSRGGEVGKAVEYLSKGARLLEGGNEDKALAEHMLAVRTAVPDDADVTTDFVRLLGAKEVFPQAIRYCLEQDCHEKALEVLARQAVFCESTEAEHSLHKLYLTECIVTLAMGDYVKADQAFREKHLQSTSYLYQPECKLEEHILAAFKQYDQEALEKAKVDGIIGRLDPPVARLAKSLHIGEGLDVEEEEESRAAAYTAMPKPQGSVSDVRARLAAMGGHAPPPAPAPVPSIPAPQPAGPEQVPAPAALEVKEDDGGLAELMAQAPAPATFSEEVAVEEEDELEAMIAAARQEAAGFAQPTPEQAIDLADEVGGLAVDDDDDNDGEIDLT
ncbi:unnamed protein product [Chrysoparadoxa australica]